MKVIKLSNRGETIVSNVDFDYLSQFNWIMGSRGYVFRHNYLGNRRTKIIKMHREVMNFPKEQVDHINMNKLDNRRSNLRVATNSQNKANGKKYVNNNSGYKGVYYEKLLGKYRAYVNEGGVRKYLGSYPTAMEAKVVRDQKALEIYGEFYTP